METPQEPSKSSPSSLCNTPTHTSVTDVPFSRLSGSLDVQNEKTPWPGETFVICARDSDHTITLVDGKLEAREGLSPLGGFHWACVEKNGWLGFKNTVSGTYIGHDTKGNYWAKYHWHKSHEEFCARRHPRGGYILLMRHGDVLKKMTINSDKNALIVDTNEGDGTAWNFVKA